MIRHEIRSKDGGTKEVSLTPLKAIRYQCLECLGWSPQEIKNCTGNLCALYPYRLGSNSERKGIGRTDQEFSSR